jgi:hypothetical protein
VVEANDPVSPTHFVLRVLDSCVGVWATVSIRHAKIINVVVLYDVIDRILLRRTSVT